MRTIHSRLRSHEPHAFAAFDPRDQPPPLTPRSRHLARPLRTPVRERSACALFSIPSARPARCWSPPPATAIPARRGPRRAARSGARVRDRYRSQRRRHGLHASRFLAARSGWSQARRRGRRGCRPRRFIMPSARPSACRQQGRSPLFSTTAALAAQRTRPRAQKVLSRSALCFFFLLYIVSTPN
jgi:hypothetical protein